MRSQREALTVRFPAELLSHARDVKPERESLNEFVVDAVQREVRRRQGMQAYAEILRIREEIRAQSGPHPDSTPLVRALRQGEERW